MPGDVHPHATLQAVIARVEHQLAELDRRTAECSLCHSADLRRHLGELRQLLSAGSRQAETPARVPVGAHARHG